MSHITKITVGDNEKELEEIGKQVVETLKDIYDPEIPASVFDIGLIYEVKVLPERIVYVKMTLTSPNCPVAESMPLEIEERVAAVQGVEDVDLELTFEPPWDPSMMTDAARLECGLF